MCAQRASPHHPHVASELRESAMSEQTEDPGQLFAERQRRIYDAVALKPVDRVPIMYHTNFWFATYSSIPIRRFLYEYDLVSEVTKKIVAELNPDAVGAPHATTSLGPTLDLLGYRQLEWAGHGAADNVSYQYRDHEWMTAEEYDEYIDEPSWYYFTKVMPRIADAYAHLAKLPKFAGWQHLRMIHCARFFGDPDVINGFAKLAEAGREAVKLWNIANGFGDELAALGWPSSVLRTCVAPYDFFADTLRGSKGIMLDLRRRPEKLLAAMERAIPLILRATIPPKLGPCRLIFMPMHWSIDRYMSPDQFRHFFWAPLRKVLMALIDAGLVPVVFWEGNCTSRLEIIADIPKGKCIYWFESGDIFLAKQVLGDHVCLRGNVPASMLNAGSPDEVTEYSKKLIDIVGKNDGFMLDGAIGIPDEARLENVKAMYAAVHHYGRYD
jgi:uroporphyrinogen-III decarboxylase